MRFSILNVLKSSAPTIFLVLALPLVAQRAEVSDQPDPVQLTFVSPNPETVPTAPSARHEHNNRVEGYFALAGFALITVLCRKR
jgi:hypothetical protein